MFGHDEQKNTDNPAMPTDDGVLGNSQGAPALATPAPVQADDTASQAYIATPTGIDDKKPEPIVTVPSGDGDLLTIKQNALKQLTPLVDHLDQTPEERFRTTMMMIQASDNQALIKDAYAAAQEISDEKTRAQALLDIINEINYFTQHNQ